MKKFAKECGFNSLSVRAVKELVTFRSDSMLKSPKILNAGRHLSATEFHHILQEAGNSSKWGNKKKEDVILLDVRNVYETRIGMFKVENVDTLDPKIRQYSDLATWMDDHSERLRNKKVLIDEENLSNIKANRVLEVESLNFMKVVNNLPDKLVRELLKSIWGKDPREEIVQGLEVVM
ncbi:hypothetical protein HPP92_003748 [Vanilla planifolia]|uniref:Uncharacterized protein n=2 Tax=Vanilla planifolia TaxID=51239 RepID=A0A835VHI0_VANPL|nr:hypothetical protein HPP92_003748 [Vanilla planifolia]